MNPKKILLAIDEHESSARAVEYVGGIAGNCPDFTVTLMHVIEEPSEDFFEHPSHKNEFIRKQTDQSQQLLADAKARLMELGLAPDRIDFKTPVKKCASMAACILEEADGGFGTLVVGRRGIPKSEEFLFGSVSKKIVDFAKKCTVWVVE
ncbi:MAG: universal stress protein [Pseudomonadota bacterium]